MFSRTAPARPAHQPLKVMFLHTSAVIGGAETLMLNLIRRMDRTRFAPELCCLKGRGPLGDVLAEEIPVFERLIDHKYDWRVVLRLRRLFRQRGVDAVISVGAGDKMFWGRLAAVAARVPVVICAIHSTGWPDRIGRLNRLLTPVTDAFVGVAAAHGRYLIEEEGFPPHRVRVIPNGVDTEVYAPRQPDMELRRQLGIPPGPVAGVVARLSEEKNIGLFLDAAALVRREIPAAQFIVIGDGPLRGALENQASKLGIRPAVHFLGWRSDVPELLALFDAFVLSSHIEANPVSILEALSAGVPVVATRVGSVPETVQHGIGFLVDPGDEAKMAQRIVGLFRQPALAQSMGRNGRRLVTGRWSLECMVRHYQELIEEIYRRKRPRQLPPSLADTSLSLEDTGQHVAPQNVMEVL